MGLLTEPNHLLLGATQPLYQIDRSLRFNDDDSAYLSRTPGSAGNRRTWTWSGWVKRGRLGPGGSYGDQVFLSSGTTLTDDGFFSFEFHEDNTINITTGATQLRKTTALYRDTSAWYHIVLASDTTQAVAANRLKLYVNGTEVTAFSVNNNMVQDHSYSINNTVAHAIGRREAYGPFYFDGYMAEIHFIDGTALTPTSFGEFDENGVWRPIQVSGLTYGTNGFYLSFADNTSTTTLGYDDAGSNDWTLTNFSVTAGAGNDSLEDTPTNNFATLNSVEPGITGTISNGNLSFTGGGAATYVAYSTIALSSNVYVEAEVTSIGNVGDAYLGICPVSTNGASSNPAATSTGYAVFDNKNGSTNSAFWTSGTETNNVKTNTANITPTVGDILGLAFKPSTGEVWFSFRGSWLGGGDPAAGTSPTYSGLSTTSLYKLFVAVYGTTTPSAVALNAGQRPFAYTPPTGYSALCTANLPTPDIADPGSYMNAVTYTGTGSSLGVTGVGFQPDLVWIKGRSGATDHAVFDSVRGVWRRLETNNTDDEVNGSSGLTAFDPDGFTIGTLAQVNTSSATYVGWCWREGVTPGFDVVTYTGTGVARTIAHNLGTTPKLIIVKARSTASTDQGWPVYHASNTTAPETDYLLLNSTAATADLDTVWNDTAPTTTVFSVGTNALVNALNDTYVAYLFAEVEGFSKFGSYTGNGSSDGPFVWAGHRPRYVLFKRTDTIEGWYIYDTARDTFNALQNELRADSSGAEAVFSSRDFLSNGFKIRSSNGSVNASGGTYIFAAFAEQPFSAPANAR